MKQNAQPQKRVVIGRKRVLRQRNRLRVLVSLTQELRKKRELSEAQIWAVIHECYVGDGWWRWTKRLKGHRNSSSVEKGDCARLGEKEKETQVE